MFRGIRQNSTGIAHLAVGRPRHRGVLGGRRPSRASASTSARGTASTPATPGRTVRARSSGTSRTSTRRSASASAAACRSRRPTPPTRVPNNSFSTVKEIMFKLAVDDSAHLGKGAVKPYVILAQELDTAPGLGQADGGAKAGTYLELGVAPGYARPKASVAVPVKVGLSLSNYYELDGTDNKFGFFSIAGIVTVPLGVDDDVRRVEPPRRRGVPGARRHHEVLQRRRRLPGDRVHRDWVFLLTRCLVLDLVFVGVSILFFVVSIGYVAACDRLMK